MFSAQARDDIPIEHLDFAYIEKCSDVTELEHIFLVLRNGEQGYYEALERACEDKIRKLDPKSKVIIKDNPIGSKYCLQKAEIDEMDAQMKNWRENSSSNIGNQTKEYPIRTKGEIDLFKKFETSENLAEILPETDSLSDKELLRQSVRYREKGNEAFHCGDWEEALGYYSASMTYCENNSVANNRGLTYMKMCKYEEAIVDFNMVLSSEENPRALLRKGKSLYELHQYEKAEKTLQKYIELKPDDNYAKTLMNKINNTTSKTTGKKMKIIEVENSAQNSNYSQLYYRIDSEESSGNYDSAVDILSWIFSIEKGESCEKLLKQRAKLYFQLGDYWAGIADLTHIITEYGGNAEIYAERAGFFEKLEKYCLAYKDCKRALETSSVDDIVAGNKLENISCVLNKIYGQEWREYADSVVLTDEMSAKIRKKLFVPVSPPKIIEQIYGEIKLAGNELVRNGNHSEAICHYQNCINLKTNDFTAILNIALCYLQIGDFDLAGKHCSNVIKKHPQNIKALYRRALALKGLGKPREALRDLEEILSVESYNIPAQNERKNVLEIINSTSGQFRKIDISIVDESDDELI